MSICGTCNLCCKLRGVAELNKPHHSWCTHAVKGVGCAIHKDKPSSCKTYVCLYYQMAEEGHPLPEEFRPDKSKVIVDTLLHKLGEIFLVWPDIPGAENSTMIHRLMTTNNSIIVCRETLRIIIKLTSVGGQILLDLGVSEKEIQKRQWVETSA